MKFHYEKVLCPDTQSFTTEDVVGPVIDCVFHVHPEYELTYVASSHGSHFVGTCIDSFRPGTLTLYGPMLPHHYFSSPSDSLSETWGHARVLKFKELFSGVPIFDVPEFARVKRMLEASRCGLDFPEAASAKAAPKIEALFKAEGAARLLLLLEILEELSRSDYRAISPGSEAELAVQPDERINRILREIHSHIESSSKISLSAIAAKASLSPEAFCRFFKKATRKSLVSYVNEMKLERACQRLLNGDDTVAEICYGSGFNNLSNFNRQFAKRKGLTPVQYRKRFRKA